MTPQEVNNIILFITFIAILWYSWETHRMRNEIASQKRIELRPVIIIYKGEKDKFEIFRIKNIGRGIALKVKIEKIILEEESDITFELTIGEPNILIPGEIRDIEGEAKMGDVVILGKDMRSMTPINPKYANKNFKFEIVYEDIDKKAWFTETEITIDGPKVIRIDSK